MDGNAFQMNSNASKIAKRWQQTFIRAPISETSGHGSLIIILYIIYHLDLCTEFRVNNRLTFHLDGILKSGTRISSFL